jgi:hypothetical protein
MGQYWLRIMAGSVAVFVLGYGAVVVGRKVARKGEALVESSDPVSIPLAFIPFNLDGSRQGTFRRLTLIRESPNSVGEIRLRVKLSDSVDRAALARCRLTPAGLGGFDLERGFACVSTADSSPALAPYGEVTFLVSGAAPITVPLLLDSASISELRSGHSSADARVAIQEAAAARVEAERIAKEVTSRIQAPKKP